MRLGLAGAFLFALAGASGYAVVWHLIRTDEVPAPDLLALPLEEAAARASESGFAVRVAVTEPSPRLTGGAVLAQRPQPGDWAKDGAIIVLTVAR